MIIDSHQHFWKYTPKRDTWMDDSMAKIRRDFLPEDLKPILKTNGVDGCIAVQADQSENETNFLLDLANTHDMIRGVVGWVDLTSPTIEDRLAHFSKQPKFKGVRHIIQAESEDFVLRKDFQHGMSKLQKYNLTYDILVYPNQLPNIIKLVSKFPEQIFVVDHLAKPYIKDKKIHPWKHTIEQLALFDNVYCKVSGLVTEADWHQWRYTDFIPYLDIVFNAFGIKRVLFGSDWPVSTLAGQYHQILEIITTYSSQFTNDQQASIMGKNALDCYKLES